MKPGILDHQIRTFSERLLTNIEVTVTVFFSRVKENTMCQRDLTAD